MSALEKVKKRRIERTRKLAYRRGVQRGPSARKTCGVNS
jgi:hypothetical protein